MSSSPSPLAVAQCSPAPPPALSIVVPAYNEQENVELLYDSIVATLAKLEQEFEIVLIDDGSSDHTFARMSALAARDRRVRVIKLRRNYGQTAAMVAGIDHARGDVLITMDADLQNDPADIPRLLDQIRAGHDLVVGWRQKRQDSFSRRLPSIVANRLIAKVTGIAVKDNGCTLKAYRAELIKQVPLYGDMHRFIPAMASIPGCQLAEIEVRHHPRRFGQSKYTMSRIWKVLIDMITIKTLMVFAQRPLFCFMNGALVALLLSIGHGLLAMHGGFTISGGASSAVFMNVAILLGSLAMFLSLIGMTGALIHQLASGEAWSTMNLGPTSRADGEAQPMLMERTQVVTADTAPAEMIETLSVVVPVLPDGGAGLSETHRAYRAALAGQARALEFIYVIGRDNTAAVAALTRLKEAGEPLTALVLNRWDDEGIALRRGIRRASGTIVLTLPAHLQVPPEELPEVLAALPGHDMVVARRRPALGIKIDTVEATVFHWLIERLFGRSFKDLVCRVRAGRRPVFEEIVGYGVPQHFLPLVTAERGFRLVEVDVRAGRDAQGGQPGPLAKLLARCRLGFDVLGLYIVLKFVRKPLRFFGAIGLPILAAGTILTGALAIGRLFFGVPLADRPILILGVLLIVLGIQVIAIGLIGEIVVFAAGRRIEDYTVERIL